MKLRHIAQYVKQTISDNLHGVHKLRSSKWPAFRERMLQILGGCAVCGSLIKRQLHHIVPFHIDQTKELLENNVIVLCEVCECGDHHLNYGHLGNFKNYNPHVVEDCEDARKRGGNHG